MNYKTYFEIKENRFVGFQHTLLTVDTHKTHPRAIMFGSYFSKWQKVKLKLDNISKTRTSVVGMFEDFLALSEVSSILITLHA